MTASDDLRKIADRLTQKYYMENFDPLRKCADAWEKQRDDWNHLLEIQQEENGKQQARIEALEKEVAAWKLAAYHDDWSGITTLATKEDK